jgi:hypothetical protein
MLAVRHRCWLCNPRRFHLSAQVCIACLPRHPKIFEILLICNGFDLGLPPFIAIMTALPVNRQLNGSIPLLQIALIPQPPFDQLRTGFSQNWEKGSKTSKSLSQAWERDLG